MNAYKTLYSRSFELLSNTLKNRFFLWNVFGNFGPLIIGLFAIPYVYGHSAKDYVGFLTLTWAAIGYTGLFDFGLSRALFYFTSLGKNDHSIDVEKAFLNSAIFAILISLVINAALLIFIDSASKSLSLKGYDQINSLWVISLSLPVYLISNMLRSSLEGMELFRQANIFKFISYLSLFVCPAILIAIGDKSLAHVCIFYAVVRLLAGLYAFYMFLPHLVARRDMVVGRIAIPMRTVLGFGGWATVSSTISPLMVYGDRFAIAYFNGASAVAIYALLQELIGKTILLSASYVTAIQPKLGYLPEDAAAELYARERKNVALLSVGIYTGCVLVSPLFVSRWLNVSINDVALLAIVMSVGFMFNSMAQAPLAYLLARGRPRRVATAHTLEAVLYFPLLIGAAMRYGVIGAAVVGVLRQIFDYGILSWQAQRKTA